MKRLTITPEEIKDIKEYIIAKFENASNNDIEAFEIKKDEIKEKLKEVQLNNVKTPILRITPETYIKMYQLVEQSATEISWHGLVDRDKETGVYTFYHIMMFPQINTGVSTTTDDKEFAEWQQTLIEDPAFPIEDLRMHGHSHVNMGVFSSGIDDQYQADLIRKIEPGDYYIFMILNKKHEHCIFIYDYDQNILFDTNDIKIEILNDENEDIITEVANEITTLCKTAEPAKRGVNGNYYGKPTGYYDYHEEDYLYDAYMYKSGRIRGGRR